MVSVDFVAATSDWAAVRIGRVVVGMRPIAVLQGIAVADSPRWDCWVKPTLLLLRLDGSLYAGLHPAAATVG